MWMFIHVSSVVGHIGVQMCIAGLCLRIVRFIMLLILIILILFQFVCITLAKLLKIMPGMIHR